MTERNSNLDFRGRPRVQTEFHDESLTVQSDAASADINKILKRYKALGIVDHLRDVEMRYADVSEFTDYADLMRQVKIAEQEFMSLPAVARAVFDNDVGKWLDAAHGTAEEQADVLEEFGVEAPPADNPVSGETTSPAGSE